ncbi:hypothetical protein COU37_02195 [Candidatus Micrarchaeota archaeon CG10_big_fil_rev_8_21_14_0_10_45_29]|nr:MAG: hypothetical protein COU37_02195 [Candidatus Micrarchaeota archaeon CG10_big_fil_rev_8_21_14_0_10_45_29]
MHSRIATKYRRNFLNRSLGEKLLVPYMRQVDETAKRVSEARTSAPVKEPSISETIRLVSKLLLKQMKEKISSIYANAKAKIAGSYLKMLSKIHGKEELICEVNQFKQDGKAALKNSIQSNANLTELLYKKAISFQKSMKIASKIPANGLGDYETEEVKYANALLKNEAMEITYMANVLIDESISVGGKSTSIWDLAKYHFLPYKRVLCFSVLGVGTACAAGIMAFTGQLPVALGVFGFAALAAGITNEVLRSMQNSFKEALKLAKKIAEPIHGN